VAGNDATNQPAAAEPEVIFAYGTLLPQMFGAIDLPLAVMSALQSCHPEGPATVTGTLHDCGPYPALTLNGTRPVRGHLLRLPPRRGRRLAVLETLDEYEGTGRSLYRRQRAIATTMNGSAANCWVWTYLRDTTNLPVVEDGCWIAYHGIR
jgi:gamma-glutamylcyclotransferase (GGCT)/AIG2-like uncharacterized protein YtfP